MHLEIDLGHRWSSFLKPTKDEYERALEIIARQIPAELGWEVWGCIVKEDKDNND